MQAPDPVAHLDARPTGGQEVAFDPAGSATFLREE